MEYKNPRNRKNNRCLNSDRISTLPQNIIERILIRMPIRDALRTSILSKKWRYSWRGMPQLVFTDTMVKLPSDCHCRELTKYKIINTILDVLLQHNGEATLVMFYFSVQMDSDFDKIITYLSRGNMVKELIIIFIGCTYRLPASFFSLKGLERINLFNCEFEVPLAFSGFSRLKRMVFGFVAVSAKMLLRFISGCPLLDQVVLQELFDEEDFDFAGGNTFTFVELLRCVPSICILDASKYYMKYLVAGGMPHKLPKSLVHLKFLHLDVCLMEKNEVSAALCLIRSSPLLKEIIFMMYDNENLPAQQTPTNFLDPENHSDLKLGRLETLEITKFSNSPLEMEFVKLIMAKSPVLKKVRIELSDSLSLDKEVKILMELCSFPQASPSAKLIIERPQTFFEGSKIVQLLKM